MQELLDLWWLYSAIDQNGLVLATELPPDYTSYGGTLYAPREGTASTYRLHWVVWSDPNRTVQHTVLTRKGRRLEGVFLTGSQSVPLVFRITTRRKQYSGSHTSHQWVGLLSEVQPLVSVDRLFDRYGVVVVGPPESLPV